MSDLVPLRRIYLSVELDPRQVATLEMAARRNMRLPKAQAAYYIVEALAREASVPLADKALAPAAGSGEASESDVPPRASFVQEPSASASEIVRRLGDEGARRHAEKKCLQPSCPRMRSSRGLCERHYLQARHQVHVGRLSWEWLSNRGKIIDLKIPFPVPAETVPAVVYPKKLVLDDRRWLFGVEIATTKKEGA